MRHAPALFRTLPLSLLALCACTPGGDRQSATSETAAPAEAATVASGHAFNDAIDAGDFAEHVQQLASDAFGGRGPGTPGEDKTVDYLKAQRGRHFDPRCVDAFLADPTKVEGIIRELGD